MNRDSAAAGESKMQLSAHVDTQSGFHNQYIKFHLWSVYISMNTGFQEQEVQQYDSS